MNTEEDHALRERIASRLRDGLETHWKKRAYDSAEVRQVISKLNALSPGDLDGQLVEAGFTDFPYVPDDDELGIEQSCATCMYYKRSDRFCDLPELMLPVEPQWSCNLWRI